MMTSKPTINLRIKEVMEEEQISQKQLCTITGIPEESLSRQLKRGKMNLDRLAVIAQALNVDIRDLISSPVKKEVKGYVEYGNDIYSFQTFKRLKEIVNILEEQINRPQKIKEEADRIRRIEKANISKVKPSTQLPTFEEIVLDRVETYDATVQNCWSFRNAGDVRDGVVLDLGNMVSGYEFDMLGQHFLNSEAAYIAGAYSMEGERYADIQRMLSTWDNGYTAKSVFRKQHNEYTRLIRQDWTQFNIQWMLLVIWEKCKSNSTFRDILLSIPRDAVIIENSTDVGAEDPTKSTSTIWGCWNRELMDARYVIEEDVANRTSAKSKKEIERRQMVERNKINHIGIWRGKNLMGKIHKLCQIALLTNTEPPIDYNLLDSGHIYWFSYGLKYNI